MANFRYSMRGRRSAFGVRRSPFGGFLGALTLSDCRPELLPENPFADGCVPLYGQRHLTKPA
jgi:hypothetical protein